VPRLFMLTVPGLRVASDWAAVHDRLLDDFPGITDVLATTMTATLLIVYEGEASVDAWLEGVSDGILSRGISAGNAPRVRAQSSVRGHQRAWGVRPARDRGPCPRGPYQLNHSTPPTEGTT
jgi:hypothetical protein